MNRKILLSILSAALVLSLSLSGVACLQGPATETKTGPVVDVHSDGDGIPDHIEKQLGLDPNHFDSDRDGISDRYEIQKAIEEFHKKNDKKQPAGKAGNSASMKDGSELVGTSVTNDAPTMAHDASNGWQRNIRYLTNKNVATALVAGLKTARGWWKTTASGAYVPTAGELDKAMLALLQDEASTSAPLLDEIFYADQTKKGNEIEDLIMRNDDAVPGCTDDTQVSQAQAIKLWSGVETKAKIQNGFLDQDADGIPNIYETFGFKISKASGGGLNRIEPWGIRMKGNSQYDAASFKDIPTYGSSKASLPIDIVGGDFEVIGDGTNEKPDYSVAYFKTDPTLGSSEYDPIGDNAEASVYMPLSMDSLQKSNPARAARPELVTTVVTFSISPVGTTKQIDGSSYPEVGPSQFEKAKTAVTGLWNQYFGPKPTPTAMLPNRPGLVGYALAADDPAEPAEDPTQKVQVEMKTGFLSKLGGGVSSVLSIVNSVTDFLSPSPTGRTLTATTEKESDAAHAADLMVGVRIANNGSAQAADTYGTLNVCKKDDIGTPTEPIKSVNFGDKVKLNLDPGGKSPGVVVIDQIPLSLNQLNAFTSGAGGFGLQIDEASLHSEVKVPVYDETGKMLKVVDAGSWETYRTDINGACATLMVDNGGNGFVKLQIATNLQGGGDVTLRDAVQWALADYDMPSSAKGGDFKLNGMKMRGSDGNLVTIAKDAKAMIDSGKWAIMLSGDDYKDADTSKPFDIRLKGDSVIYLFNRDVIAGDKGCISWARLVPHGGAAEILDGSQKRVEAGVKLRLVKGDVYMKPTPTSPQQDWVKMTDPEGSGIYKADLPASYQHTLQETVQVKAMLADETITNTATVAYATASGHPVSVVTDYPASDKMTGQIAFLDLDARTPDKAISGMQAVEEWGGSMMLQRTMQYEENGPANYGAAAQTSYLSFAASKGADVALDFNKYVSDKGGDERHPAQSITLYKDDKSDIDHSGHAFYDSQPTTPPGFRSAWIDGPFGGHDFYLWQTSYADSLLQYLVHPGTPNLLGFRYGGKTSTMAWSARPVAPIKYEDMMLSDILAGSPPDTAVFAGKMNTWNDVPKGQVSFARGFVSGSWTTYTTMTNEGHPAKLQYLDSETKLDTARWGTYVRTIATPFGTNNIYEQYNNMFYNAKPRHIALRFTTYDKPSERPAGSTP